MNTGCGFFGQAFDILQILGIFIMHNLGEVSAVIQNEVRTPSVRTFDGHFNTPPEFFLGHAFPGKNRNIRSGHGSRSLILGRENVTGGPANLGAKSRQGFDQNSRLNGHVQATGNPGTSQRFGGAKFFAQCHQARHFSFGNGYFLASPVSQGHVGNFKVFRCAHWTLFSR